MAFALEEEGLNELFNMGYIYESKSTLCIDKELMLVTDEEVDTRIKKIFRYFRNLNWHTRGLGPEIDNASRATNIHQSIIQVKGKSIKLISSI